MKRDSITLLHFACVVLTCAISAFARQPESAYFGVDSAVSWLAPATAFGTSARNCDTYARTISQIAETGFRHVRERLSWNAVNPAADNWDFSHYLRIAGLYRTHGIRVSGMFHDAPSWMKSNGKLPVDLKAVYEFCRKTSETFGDVAEDWEFWNEEDIGFCPASAWDYVAAAKAAYLGFKDASAERPALMGALCLPSRSAYDYLLFENGLGAYTDAFNFHTYASLRNYPKVFGELHAFRDAVGMGERALWVTESGTHQEGVSVHDGVLPGLRAHSVEQELLHAEIAAKSQFELMMQGVSRDYFFVFPPYNEMTGTKDWGIVRRDGTLKPAAKMFSDMIASLGTCRIVGEVDVGTTNVHAYAFRQADGRDTLAYVAVGPADRCEQVRPGERTPDVSFRFRGHDLVARALPQYLANLDRLPVSRPARSSGQLGTPPSKADEDRRVVMQLVVNPKELRLGGGKSMLEVESECAALRLVAYNFDGSAKTGTVTCSNARVTGLPASVVIPAWGRVELSLVFKPDSDRASDRLEFGGVFGGRRITPLVAPVTNLEALFRSCTCMTIPTGPRARWNRNDSADTFETQVETNGETRIFHLVWKRDCDRWVYPKHPIRAGALKGAAVLTFEIRSEQDKIENDFNCAHVLLNGGGFGTRFLPFPPPIGHWETRRIDLTSEKDLEKVDSISIGANPRGRDLRYWIRNVRVYLAK